MKSDDNKLKDQSVTLAMRASARYVAIGLGILAASVAAFALLVFLSRVVPTGWYGWARIITSDYSSVTPALWINWVSVLTAGWSLGVAYKLGNANYETSKKFALLMLGIVLFGVIPSACALGTVLADLPWPFDYRVSLLEKIASATVVVTWILIATGVSSLVIACGFIVSSSKG